MAHELPGHDRGCGHLDHRTDDHHAHDRRARCHGLGRRHALAPPPTVQGTVTFQATGLDFTAVADWIKRVGDLPEFSNLWVPSAQKSTLGDQDVVTFSSSAGLTDKARSDRSVAADNAAKGGTP